MEREKHPGATSYEGLREIEINNHTEYWMLHKKQDLKVM